jgi:hypothetical protein
MAPELQAAIEQSMVVIANMRTGFKGRMKLRAAKAFQGIVYLDFVYTGSRLYRPLSKAFGRKF